MQERSLRDETCRKLFAGLRAKGGSASWGELNRVVRNPHTLQSHLDHLRADAVIVRDPPDGGRGVRGVYAIKKPGEEESQFVRRITSIVEAWTEAATKAISTSKGGEAKAMARFLEGLTETRKRETAIVILAAQRVCESCIHLSEQHEGLTRGVFERCNVSVALEGEKFKRCGCKRFKPDGTGVAGMQFYFDQVRRIGAFTDDIAFAVLTKHREFALPAVELWLGEKLKIGSG